jgi:hypothetical protein
MFALGVLLTLAGAYLYPFPETARSYSQSSSLPDGGREEAFFIRLPEDRIGSPRAAATAAFPTQAFAAVGADRVLAELFKLRDVDGQVIGIASRMNGVAPEMTNVAESVTDWMVLIPGRGGLTMSRGTVGKGKERDFLVDRMGLSSKNSGNVIAGTGDFAGLTGFYGEETTIDRIDPNGDAYGMVKLITRLQQEVEL